MGADKTTVKITHNGVGCVRFKDTELVEQLTKCRRGTITLYGTMSKNVWNGRTTPQLMVKDWEITDTSYEF